MKEGERLVVVLLYLMYWTQAQITFEVQEELQAPLKLGNIATKANLTQTPDLEFFLLNRYDLFAVHPSTGDFSVIVVLDREGQCGPSPSCVITALVAVSRSPEFLYRYTVNVTVLDSNDQKPYFKFSNFLTSLSEFARIHTAIKLPTAEDNDMEPAFKVHKYYLQPESHMFDLVVQRVNKSDGSVDFDVQLRLNKKLDRESNDSYTLTLVVSDMGNEGYLQVIVTVTDENDNSPVFQTPGYNITINKITPINKTVLIVSATDADVGENGRVEYEMTKPGDNDPRALKYFQVDSASGAVKLVKSLPKEGQTVFTFLIQAFDHGTPVMASEAYVIITVEDTVNAPPVISVSLLRPKNNSSSVPEDARIGTPVASILVTDTNVGQNGRTHCTCTSETFNMTEYSPGMYTISVAGVLDREKIATHIITIQCVDRGMPPLSSVAELSVIVEDVNDNPPQFTREFYEMKVRENQESGVLVGNVFATDADDGANAELRYSLDPSVVEFEINESNGSIYTAMKNLDRELKDHYNFSVYAFDTTLSPLTATATVTVNIEDMNDEWPRFENSSYTFVVSESTGKGTVIGKVHATDPDLGVGGMVEYVLVHNSLDLDPLFIVSKDSGEIILTRSLDYETTKLYSLVVAAVDLGSPPRNSSVEVHIEKPKANKRDDDVDWGDDFTEEAIKQRMEELSDAAKGLAFTDDLETSAEERLNMIYKLLKLKRDDDDDELIEPAVIKNLLSEAERLEVTDRVLALVELLLNEKTLAQGWAKSDPRATCAYILYSLTKQLPTPALARLQKFKHLFLRFCAQNLKAQKSLLGGLEILLAKEYPELKSKTSHLVTDLYDLYILEEAVILEWGKKVVYSNTQKVGTIIVEPAETHTAAVGTHAVNGNKKPAADDDDDNDIEID